MSSLEELWPAIQGAMGRSPSAERAAFLARLLEVLPPTVVERAQHLMKVRAALQDLHHLNKVALPDAGGEMNPYPAEGWTSVDIFQVVHDLLLLNEKLADYPLLLNTVVLQVLRNVPLDNPEGPPRIELSMAMVIREL